jgi:hypothetical protein
MYKENFAIKKQPLPGLDCSCARQLASQSALIIPQNPERSIHLKEDTQESRF